MKDEAESRRAEEERLWERGGQERETLQRRRMSQFPLSEKLQWREEARRKYAACRRTALLPPPPKMTGKVDLLPLARPDDTASGSLCLF